MIHGVLRNPSFFLFFLMVEDVVMVILVDFFQVCGVIWFDFMYGFICRRFEI